MPLVIALTVLAIVGLALLCARKRAQLAAAVFVAACVGAAFLVYSHRIAPSNGFAKVQRWAQVGRFLRQAHPGALIATVPIGAISYFSGNPVIDLVGLTSREVAHAGRTIPDSHRHKGWLGHERHNTEWVLSQRPELIVLGTKRSRHPVHDVQALRAGYYAEWLLVRAAKEHRIPYDVYTPEVAKGVYWHMLRRRPESP
jgi:hypothetical protein